MYLHNAGGNLIPDPSSPIQVKRMPKSNLGFASVFSSNPNLFKKISQVERTMRRPHDVERYFVDMRATLINSFEKFHLELSGITAHIICNHNQFDSERRFGQCFFLRYLCNIKQSCYLSLSTNSNKCFADCNQGYEWKSNKLCFHI